MHVVPSILLTIVGTFNSLEEVVEQSKALNPIEKEGYVCSDVKFNRVKVHPLPGQVANTE